MSALEILWILGTIFCIWWSYKWIKYDIDGLMIFLILISVWIIVFLIMYFGQALTTPLW